MTSDPTLSRVLERWLDDGPTEMPDRVLDVVAERIARQAQRHASRLPRRTTMTKSTSILALAAAIAIAVVGWSLLGGRPSVGGPGPATTATPSPSLGSPAASASASPAIRCEDDLAGCAGPLDAGTHRSTQLVPPLQYDLPDGSWANVIDLRGLYKIDSADGPQILVWTEASIADQATPCSTDPDPTRGRNGADWVEFLTTHPGVVASDVIDLSVGGVQARQFELSVAPDWTQTCPGHVGPYVMLLTQAVGDQVAEYGLPSDGRLLLTLIDIGSFTVVVQAYGPTDPTEFDRTMGPVRTIIDSFVMCGPSLGRSCGSLKPPLPSLSPSVAP
jgi:hypothetical protein